MLQLIYRIALWAVVVLVFIILVAPDIDLPDSTGLRANHGAYVLANSIQFVVILLSLIWGFFAWQVVEIISTRFDSPSNSSLCTFLC